MNKTKQSNLSKYYQILLFIRTFLKKIISEIEINYVPTNFQNTIILTIKNIKYFWYVILLLKNSLLFNYNQLNDITCIDNLNLLKITKNLTNYNRFTLLYIFTNIKYNSRLLIKFNINKNQKIPSINSIFKGANWLEREIFDLFD